MIRTKAWPARHLPGGGGSWFEDWITKLQGFGRDAVKASGKKRGGGKICPNQEGFIIKCFM